MLVFFTSYLMTWRFCNFLFKIPRKLLGISNFNAFSNCINIAFLLRVVTDTVLTLDNN